MLVDYVGEERGTVVGVEALQEQLVAFSLGQVAEENEWFTQR